MIFSRLFASKRDLAITILLIFLAFLANISYEYYKFLKYKEKKIQNLNATVLLSYTKTNKKNKKYQVFKTKSENFVIYITSKNLELKINKNDNINFKIITKNLKFADFLKRSFYAPSFKIKKINLPPSNYQKAYNFIQKQHKDEKLQELYGALFLASSIGKELREDVMFWGVSHLVAISGYHLGIIFGALFFAFNLAYKPLQDKFFPYRNAKIDLSVICFIIIFAYLAFISFVPSFLRSFVMSIIGFLLVIKRVQILSFTNLALSSGLILAVFVNLLFSLGFWFSVMGVFYIFLYLHHFKDKFPLWLHIVFLNLWTFFAMVIPVLHWFSLISVQQLSVILISPIFAVFYPLSAILHLFGYGFLFDEFLSNSLSLRMSFTNLPINTGYFALYMLLSFIGIFRKNIAIFCIFLGILPFFFVYF